MLVACRDNSGGHSHGAHGQHEGHGGHGDHGGHGHGAEEGEKTAVVTVWGDRFEAFIEHDFLVVNRPTKFITHISDLVTLKPRTTGSITFVMTYGDDAPIRQEVKEVVRAGIYLPMIQFPKIGAWQVVIEVPWEGKVFQIKLPEVYVYRDDEEVRKAPAPVEIEGVSYLKEQQWKMGTGADLAVKRTLVERLRVTARVSNPLSAQAKVTAPVSGTLLPPVSGKLPALGEEVEAGQVLARIQPLLGVAEHLEFASQRMNAEAMKLQMAATRLQLKTVMADLDIRLAEAEAEVQKSKIERRHTSLRLQRVEMLFKQKAKSKKALEQARFEDAKAASALTVARAFVQRLQSVKVALKGLAQVEPQRAAPAANPRLPVFELKAPVSGVISERSGVVGETVHAGGKLFAIVNSSQMLIEAQVPVSQLHRLSKSRRGHFSRPGEVAVFHPLLGKGGGEFLLTSPEVKKPGRVVSLFYKVPNKNRGLRSGMVLSLALETTRAVNVVAVPNSAIVEEAGQAVAFVHVSGETYEKRELVLGIRDGAWVEVKSGVQPGERVVTKGATNVRLASLSTKLPSHGHAH